MIQDLDSWFQRGPWNSEADTSSKIQLFTRNPTWAAAFGWALDFKRAERSERAKTDNCCGLDAAERICPNERALICPNFGPSLIVAGESHWNWKLTTAGCFSLLNISIATSCQQRWKTLFAPETAAGRHSTGIRGHRNSRPFGRSWQLLARNHPKSTWCFKSSCRSGAF